MKRRSITAAALVAFACGRLFGDEDLQAVSWGQATNGLQAGIVYRPSSPQGKQYAWVTLCIRNAGDKPLRILALSAHARYWGDRLPLEIRHAGELVSYNGPVLEPPPPPADTEYVVLKPGQIDTVDGWPLARYWSLQATEEVYATFVFQSVTHEDRGVWIGVARSGTIKIKMSSQPRPAPNR